MNQERVWIDEDWKAYLRPTFDGDTSGYIRADLVQAKDAEIARLRAELDAALSGAVKVKPDRETFDAMCAMRDSINEHIPMPSLESDLLQGPENSVFCATVAEAVIAEVTRLRADLEAARSKIGGDA